MEDCKKKKKLLPKELTYEEFLRRSKLAVKVFRPRYAEYFIAEITNAWLYENNFYLRVEGVGNTEMRAIINLMEKILNKRIWIDIEDDGKKRYFKVPRSISFTTGFIPNVGDIIQRAIMAHNPIGMGDGPIFSAKKEKPENEFAIALTEQNEKFIDSLKELREEFRFHPDIMYLEKKPYEGVIKAAPQKFTLKDPEPKDLS